MNLALGQNDRYLCYISAIWEGPLHVTAELIEMIQYIKQQRQINLKWQPLSTWKDELDEEMKIFFIWKVDAEHECGKSATEFIETWMEGLGQADISQAQEAGQCRQS